MSTIKTENHLQLGGIELLEYFDGPNRGTRIARVNTGGGLRYDVMLDRGFDIGQAFMNQHSLAWLSPNGFGPPRFTGHQGIGWLWNWGGGLVTSCGPHNAGAPAQDEGEALPLHGRFSNRAGELRAITQPDPAANETEIAVSGVVRDAKIFGPNFQIERTISSRLGGNSIKIQDAITNRGNTRQPHQWLYHINLGYPLLDEGCELIFDGPIAPRDEASKPRLADPAVAKKIPAPMPEHSGLNEACGYVALKPDAAGYCHAALRNPHNKLHLAVKYKAETLQRMALWQHFGQAGDYVMGFEPANCGVEGRNVDRQRGWLQFLNPGQCMNYEVEIAMAAF